MASKNSDIEEKIIKTAEKLFATYGFSAVSIRDITSEAGVNLSAVNYYFGSKEGLILAVFKHTISTINHKRIENLKDLKARYSNGEIFLTDVIFSFFEPALGTLRDNSCNIPTLPILFARLHLEGSFELKHKVVGLFFEVYKDYIDFMLLVDPCLNKEKVSMAFLFSIGSLAYILMQMSLFKKYPPPYFTCNFDKEDFLKDLSIFSASGIKGLASD